MFNITNLKEIESVGWIRANAIVHGDCLDVMPHIPDKSVDMILADPPYGTTACKWDSIIPLKPMWEQLKRIIKPNGAIVITASQPFTTTLISSNLGMFKYEWIWEKSKAGNFVNANNTPLKLHENVCVFSYGTCANRSLNRMNYNPQDVTDVHKKWNRPQKYSSDHNYSRPSHSLNRIISKENFPSSVIKIGSEHNPSHPTQKPVKLFEYLIKTYTNPEETILDFSVGSGTTAIAAENTDRKWIAIEKDKDIFNTAAQRITESIKQKKLFAGNCK